MKGESRFSFWARWVLANSISETIGLGGAFLAGYGIISLIHLPEGAASALIIAALAIALGTAEGAIVGLAQGVVLRRRLIGIPLGQWVLATSAGALLAWTLGMPLAFVAADWTTAFVAPAVLVAAALTGAVVGAIHGSVLIRMVRAGSEV